MANRYRGEIEAEIGGRMRRLRLTLGALADLEAAFTADDMTDLARRFAGGRLRARDAARVIAAGLTGAGEPTTEEEAAAMASPEGARGYADIVVRLMLATFGAPAEGGPSPGEGGAGPFPGRG